MKNNLKQLTIKTITIIIIIESNYREDSSNFVFVLYFIPLRKKTIEVIIVTIRI